MKLEKRSTITSNHIFYFDTETTGLDPKKQDVIQIAGVMTVNGKEIGRYNDFIRPFNPSAISSKAIEVHGITKKRMLSFDAPEIAFKRFHTWVNSFNAPITLAGYNTEFDRKFLFNFYIKCNARYQYLGLFKPDLIDVLQMARDRKRFIKVGENKPKNLKLETLCNLANIEIRAHDALSDILATMSLEKWLQQFKVQKKRNPVVYKEMPEGFLERKRDCIDMKYVTLNPEGDIFLTSNLTKDPKRLEFVLSYIWNFYGE